MSGDGNRDKPARARVVAWAVSPGLIDYAPAVAAMQERAALVAQGAAPELVWLLEHPPIFTAGARARPEHLLQSARFPVHPTGRGGQLTYHGPGQRVIYTMLDIRRRGGDVRAFITALEEWIIAVLAEVGIAGETRRDRVGVWVRRPDKGGGREDKIAAIGLRVSRGVSLHGASLNVSPDLSHYDGIVPCGVSDQGVTSLADLGKTPAMEVVDNALRRHFGRLFGPTADALPLIGPATAPTLARAIS